MIRFVHPLTKEPLAADGHGHLCSSDGSGRVLFRLVAGCYDFAQLQDKAGDRVYYDAHYHEKLGPPHFPLPTESFARLWGQNSAYETLRGAVGDVKDKAVLLLGNGLSLKELTLAAEGAELVFTDLSASAVRAARSAWLGLAPAETGGRVHFHAVDALYLPYEDQAFDLIYGCAFAHHVEDLRALLAEVHRCLKPGGRCVFLDDAHSPWWQAAKRTVLRPLQALSHWKNGISPEDLRATRKGGYTQTELEGLQREIGFRHLVFRRTAFLEHLVRRGLNKLGGKLLARGMVPLARWVDGRLLGPLGVIEKHGLLLVWGYTK